MKVLFQSEKGVRQSYMHFFPKKFFIWALSAKVLILRSKNGLWPQKMTTIIEKNKQNIHIDYNFRPHSFIHYQPLFRTIKDLGVINTFSKIDLNIGTVITSLKFPKKANLWVLKQLWTKAHKAQVDSQLHCTVMCCWDEIDFISCDTSLNCL